MKQGIEHRKKCVLSIRPERLSTKGHYALLALSGLSLSRECQIQHKDSHICRSSEAEP